MTRSHKNVFMITYSGLPGGGTHGKSIKQQTIHSKRTHNHENLKRLIKDHTLSESNCRQPYQTTRSFETLDHPQQVGGIILEDIKDTEKFEREYNDELNEMNEKIRKEKWEKECEKRSEKTVKKANRKLQKEGKLTPFDDELLEGEDAEKLKRHAEELFTRYDNSSEVRKYRETGSINCFSYVRKRKLK